MQKHYSLLSEEEQKSLKTLTVIVYVLQGVSFFVGGVTLIAAVIINYIKLEDVQGTWLESHFRWQIRTFWYFLLWLVIGITTAFVIVGFFILIVNSIWFIYRVVKGGLRLSESKEMYV
jgi:uncharacterized membrane protein